MQQSRAERERKGEVIVTILLDEAEKRRIYTMTQFAEAFESKAGLSGASGIRDRLNVLTTKGIVKFVNGHAAADLGLASDRSKYGYLRFTNWLSEIDRLSGPVNSIWFEEVRRHAGTDAAHVYGGLMATLTAWAELRGVLYQGVPVGTIKRHAIGKGNAPKEAMITAARAASPPPMTTKQMPSRCCSGRWKRTEVRNDLDAVCTERLWLSATQPR